MNKITTIIKKLRLLFLVVAFAASFSFIAQAHAAAINIMVDNNSIAQGETVQVNVTMDTQGSNANAVQAEILFPANMFILDRISDGSSAVSLWINPPSQSSPGVINLAGIMPGGFTGSSGALFSFTLHSLASGTGAIQVASATMLANDGSGSPLPMTLGTTPISIAPASTSSSLAPPSAPPRDYTAPNPFTPQIVSDPNIFNGKYFLVFTTTDAESGIDHYEVLEVPSGGSVQPFSSWHVATSPYLLTDQSLSSDIYVRAVDHDGNFIVVKVPARHPYGATHNDELLIIAVFAILLVLLLFIWKSHWLRRV